MSWNVGAAGGLPPPTGVVEPGRVGTRAEPGAGGVGSNGIQPYPLNQTSTQACASVSVTSQAWRLALCAAPAKPTATREGIPS